MMKMEKPHVGKRTPDEITSYPGRRYRLVKAQQIFREHDIRHLPVLDGEKLVGMLSDRNLKEALASPGGEISC